VHSSAVVLVELGAVLLGLSVLGRLASLAGVSPIPLYLLAGLAFGEGGLLPLGTSEESAGWAGTGRARRWSRAGSSRS
jgi:CPA2 family monovalent cation:H+ antiporter-2